MGPKKGSDAVTVVRRPRSPRKTKKVDEQEGWSALVKKLNPLRDLKAFVHLIDQKAQASMSPPKKGAQTRWYNTLFAFYQYVPVVGVVYYVVLFMFAMLVATVGWKVGNQLLQVFINAQEVLLSAVGEMGKMGMAVSDKVSRTTTEALETATSTLKSYRVGRALIAIATGVPKAPPTVTTTDRLLASSRWLYNATMESALVVASSAGSFISTTAYHLTRTNPLGAVGIVLGCGFVYFGAAFGAGALVGAAANIPVVGPIIHKAIVAYVDYLATIEANELIEVLDRLIKKK